MDISPLLAQLSTDLPDSQRSELRNRLAAYLNELLLHDFGALVQVLYRVDVPEKKVKAVLQDHPNEDAGNLIADLLLQRQAEKLATKKRFRFRDDGSEEERW